MRVSGAATRLLLQSCPKARPSSTWGRVGASTCSSHAHRVGDDRIRLRTRHDRRDARPGQEERGRGRSHQRRVPEGIHRGHSPPQQRRSTLSSPIALSTSPPTSRPCSMRFTECSDPVGGSGSATSSPTTHLTPTSEPNEDRGSAASPGPSPTANTETCSATAGFNEISLTTSHQATDGMDSVIIRAQKPSGG